MPVCLSGGYGAGRGGDARGEGNGAEQHHAGPDRDPVWKNPSLDHHVQLYGREGQRGWDNVTETVERQRLQQQALEDACRVAKHANQGKTEFLSRMSHDIRTPMNAIVGMFWREKHGLLIILTINQGKTIKTVINTEKSDITKLLSPEMIS